MQEAQAAHDYVAAKLNASPWIDVAEADFQTRRGVIEAEPG